jgi:predicted nucleic acid-binding protein
MEPLAFAELPEGALLLIDSAPIIYVLEAHPKFASRFGPLFEAHAAGRVRFAVTTITIAEVLTGPMKAGDETLAALSRHSRNVAADRPRCGHRRKRSVDCERRCDWVWPTPSKAASALAINAVALVTHDRDLSRVRVLRVLS